MGFDARRVAAGLFVAAALGAGLGSGCASGASATCRTTADCSIGYCGTDGYCHEICVDTQCAPGERCSSLGVCGPPEGSGGASASSASSGTPSASSSGSTGGGGGASVGPGAGPGPGPSSSASSSASTGAGTPGHELDLCNGPSDCASPLLCRPLYVGGESRCTRACTATSGCMTGTRCETIGAEKYCAAIDVGRSCSDATSCTFACLVSQGYCTTTCQTGADCPNGYGCEPVGTPPTRVCAKLEAPCGPGDTSACIASSACDLSIQMVVGGCTIACNAASDCPRRAAGLSPWTCTNGICKRPADVAGPLETGFAPAQYACNAQGQVVNVCNDALHIDVGTFSIPNPPLVNCSAATTTDGKPGDACVDSCRYQGGCPFGSACTAVGSVGALRVGLCLPTGGGEVGSFCSSPADCVWGDCTSGGVCSRDCTADGVCPTGFTCTAGGGPGVEGLPFKRCL